MAWGSALCDMCAKLTLSWLELSSGDREFSQHLLLCTDDDAPRKICKKCHFKIRDIQDFVHEAKQAIHLLKKSQDIKNFVEARRNSDADGANRTQTSRQPSLSDEPDHSNFDSPTNENINIKSNLSVETKKVQKKDLLKNGVNGMKSAPSTKDENISPSTIKRRQSVTPQSTDKEVPRKRRGRALTAKSVSNDSGLEESPQDNETSFQIEPTRSARPKRENTHRPKKYFDDNMDVTVFDSEEEKGPRNSKRKSQKFQETEFERSDSNPEKAETVYPDDQPYQCELCSTCCNNKALFVQHLRRKHPEVPEEVVRTIEGIHPKIDSKPRESKSPQEHCDRCNMKLSKTSPSEVARHQKTRVCQETYEALQMENNVTY